MKVKMNIDLEGNTNIKNYRLLRESENNDTRVAHPIIRIEDQESENVVQTDDERDTIVTKWFPVCLRF